jgi:hypothetical protein
MAPTPSSRAFIFLPDGRLYVPESQSVHSEFRSVDRIKDELAMQGLSVWDNDSFWDDNRVWTGGELPELKVAQTHFKGEAWWCGFVPLEASRRMVWMGVIVPESDIVGDIVNRRLMLFGIGVVVFIALTALYGFFVRRYRGAVQMDADIDDAQVREMIRKGENRRCSTLRAGFRRAAVSKALEYIKHRK